MFSTIAKWIKPKARAAPEIATNSGAAHAMNTGAYSDLDRLEALLRDSDAEASDLLDAVIEQAKGTALGFALKRVAKAMEDFDFEAALAALQQARG
jgi:hypothetical protein